MSLVSYTIYNHYVWHIYKTPQDKKFIILATFDKGTFDGCQIID